MGTKAEKATQHLPGSTRHIGRDVPSPLLDTPLPSALAELGCSRKRGQGQQSPRETLEPTCQAQETRQWLTGKASPSGHHSQQPKPARSRGSGTPHPTGQQHVPETVHVRQPARPGGGLGAMLGKARSFQGQGTLPALAGVRGAGKTKDVVHEVPLFVTTVLVGPKSTPELSFLCPLVYSTNMY